MPESDRVSARDYTLLCFLTLLNVMNFVDRQLLASFANFIVPDLGLTASQFGLLTGFAFIVFYAVMGLFMGALADMVHRPRLISAGLALWSLLTAASGAARGFVSLAIPRMFIGVGESALTPTSMSLLSDRFPARRLGFASGFYYMGVPVGVGVSLLIAGYLGPAIGWRNCFYLLGAIGMVLAVVMLFVKETPRRHLATAEPQGTESITGSEATTPGRQGFRQIAATLFRALRIAPALGLTIGGGVAYHAVLGAAAFDQLWYVQERGFERAEIAQITGWIGVGAGILGNLAGGLIGDWWQRRTGLGRPLLLFWLSIVLTPIGIAYRLVPPGSPVFWLGIVTGFFGLGAFYGPTFATVQELAPPQIRGTVVAFYLLMLNFFGLGAGITGGGFLVDFFIAKGVEQPITWMLLTFTFLSMLSIPLYFLAGRRFFADRDRLFAELASS